MSDVSTADICVIACAELFRDAGEIMVSPMTTVVSIGARLARLSFAPDIVLSDGEARLIADTPPIGAPAAIEGWMPFGRVFETLAWGRRHVVMGANQIDRFGNINTTVIGDYRAPTSRLPGSGGANPIGALARRVLIIALHDKRSLAERVDFITTPGYLDGPGSRERWGLPPDTGPQVIITNKALMRFDDKTKEAYLASYHPGCSVDEIVKLTPWDLKVAPDVHETEPPTSEELRVMREVLDPHRMIAIYEKRGYV